MKDKVQIHQFDPVIYPRMVWIGIGIDSDFLKDKFEFVNNNSDQLETIEGDCTGVGFRVAEIKTRHQGILMLFPSKKIDCRTIAHESVHIADYIYEEIIAYSQDFKDRNEPYAYLVGWIAGCIEKVKLGKK